MTKRQLLDALAPYSDDQYVFVLMHRDCDPPLVQIIIQGVEAVPPWHPGPPDLIGIVAHEFNRELPPAPTLTVRNPPPRTA